MRMHVIGLAAAIAASTLTSAPGVAADLRAVTAPEAPEAIGPYAQAIVAGDTLYLSGQIPLDPKTGKIVDGGIEAQTTQVMKNLAAVLAAKGMTLDDAVMANVYVTDLASFPAMNIVYGRFFKTPPARATVQVGALPRGAMIEVSLIAVRPKRR
jgi:2-iminobutanoate/2-iminopropanoate deaminase